MTARTRIFGIDIDILTMDGAVKQLEKWLQGEERLCRYVVTPNVDHVVKLSSSEPFRRAYEEASLVLADGKPVVLASKLFGPPLPQAVPGSDLVPALFSHVSESWDRELRVFFLGAAEGVAERAAKVAEAEWPGAKVVGSYSPPKGFEKDTAEAERICEQVAASGADLLVVGLGAPKQELWVQQHRKNLPVKAALCVGATIDFIAGEKARAPLWMRRLSLEWMHRVLSEPGRLGGRYANDAVVFPRLLLREWQERRQNNAVKKTSH